MSLPSFIDLTGGGSFNGQGFFFSVASVCACLYSRAAASWCCTHFVDHHGDLESTGRATNYKPKKRENLAKSRRLKRKYCSSSIKESPSIMTSPILFKMWAQHGRLTRFLYPLSTRSRVAAGSMYAAESCMNRCTSSALMQKSRSTCSGNVFQMEHNDGEVPCQ